jgi:hypothetical protein
MFKQELIKELVEELQKKLKENIQKQPKNIKITQIKKLDKIQKQLNKFNFHSHTFSFKAM